LEKGKKGRRAVLDLEMTGLSLLDVILNRASVRRYQKKPIPRDVLMKILEAGRRAPSAMNLQPWHFIVVTDGKIKEALSHRRWTGFLRDATFIIVGCGEKDKKWSTVDVAIALQNMVLAAEALGLGSCWIGDFDESEVKGLLGIPDGLKVVALVSFGYPAEKPKPRPKKPLEEIVHYDRF
jgi:nitroreductase